MKEPRLGELFNSLPDPFQNDEMLADFLVAFEQILLAGDQKRQNSLEGIIDRLAEAIDPMRAPIKDLRWIASWMGLAVDADYPTDNEHQYRTFVARTMERYRQRGTQAGMRSLLHQFTGKASNIWNDSLPHRFIVSLELGDVRDLNEIERLTRVARALIEREKPAHTCYELRPRFLSFQVAGLETVNGHRRPTKNVMRPAQIGGRDAKTKTDVDTKTNTNGSIEIGNTMLGRAPVSTKS